MPSFSILLQQFITLWVVIDPVGTLPIFLAATTGATAAARRAVAFRAVLVAFAVLLAFLIGGQIVLEALNIPLPAFQIAGGLVLLLFALTMIFGQPDLDATRPAPDPRHVAVFPVAIPSIASPGAMLAIVVLTDNTRVAVAAQAATAGLMALVLTCTLVLMLLAAPIHRVIGITGEAIISRVMGIILAAVAVDEMLRGFVAIGALPPF
ncbi:MAG: NAAT family transporter [Rhodobacteraceae bacterium]|nr:NAAT family transporter [Paracoccaceae bacterium]